MSITKDKEGYYIMRKGSTHQADLTILSICVPNIRALNYMKQILLGMKRETNYFFLTIMT